MILKYGKFPKRSTIIIWRNEPDRDNADVLLAALAAEGIPATATNDPTVRSGDNIITIGGPVVSDVTLKYNSESPIRFVSKDGYWPCSILDTRTGMTYNRADDGFVSSFRAADGADVTIIAGCERAGTDIATFEFVKELQKPSIFAKAVPYITGICAGLIAASLAKEE